MAAFASSAIKLGGGYSVVISADLFVQSQEIDGQPGRLVGTIRLHVDAFNVDFVQQCGYTNTKVLDFSSHLVPVCREHGYRRTRSFDAFHDF